MEEIVILMLTLPSDIETVQLLCYNFNMSVVLKLAQFATFETDRLFFRPFSYHDLEDFSEMVLNPRVTTFIHPGYQNRHEVAELLVEAFIKEPLGKWAIVNRKTSKVIGAIRLENRDDLQKRVEMSYFLSEEFWHQGFMSESLRTLLVLCFKEFEIRAIDIIVHEENIASQALAEACGFKIKERFKGSDRYTHKMRRYTRLELQGEDYQYE
ncbi:GNAT family N-acetyltransferase [Streptococcus sp. ZJ151]|uniref:GNAT family N-acetyltransferase n=1 Tax=Streptococcus jiangjianxini TaxID=3161189 RepID=UPI0032EE0DC9